MHVIHREHIVRDVVVQDKATTELGNQHVPDGIFNVSGAPFQLFDIRRRKWLILLGMKLLRRAFLSVSSPALASWRDVPVTLSPSSNCLSARGDQSRRKPRANRSACSTADIFAGGSVLIRSVSEALGIVVMVSKFATQGLGSPSSLLNKASVGICRMRVVTGATVTKARTA